MSSVPDPAIAKNIQGNLKELQRILKRYDGLRKSSEQGMEALNTATREAENEGVLSVPLQGKLVKAYSQVSAEAGKEEEELRKALEKIYQVRALRNEIRLAQKASGNKENIRRAAHMKMLAISAQTIPLWVGQEGEQPPELCGAVEASPNYVAVRGDMVAALVKGPEDENWILAEVVSFNQATGKYDVDDIDEEQKDRHTLSKRKVIPLPTMRANPETSPSGALHEPGTTVMAIYPQTTCFYKGVIKDQPQQPADDYEVLFEDPTYADGYSPPLNVAQRYIIKVNEKKKGK